MAAQTVPQYLTPEQAGAFLGVKPRTLVEWRRTGVGPRYSRLGGANGRVRYDIDDLRSFMRTRSHASTSAESVA